MSYSSWAAWEQHAVVTKVLNPVTRSVIRLNPVIEIHDERQLSEFHEWIVAYCQAAWEPGRIDPPEIDASNWRDGLPAGV